MVIAEKVQECMHKRSAPLLPDDLRTENDVAELPRPARWKPSERRERIRAQEKAEEYR